MATKRADKAKLGLTQGDPQQKLTPQQLLVMAYQECFRSSVGEVVLKDLRQRFSNRRSFVPDSNATAFHEGQRDIVRMIEIFLEADPLVATTINAEEQP
jgi:hypothetical protein